MENRRTLCDISNIVFVSFSNSLSYETSSSDEKKTPEENTNEIKRTIEQTVGVNNPGGGHDEYHFLESERIIVREYLRLLCEANVPQEQLFSLGLRRTNNKSSWPMSFISKSKKKNKPRRKWTCDKKQILYKAYEIPSTWIFPEGFTTWRHFS
eukprot:jgi/Galph1/281/GphlegSOOS_G5128.1